MTDDLAPLTVTSGTLRALFPPLSCTSRLGLSPLHPTPPSIPASRTSGFVRVPQEVMGLVLPEVYGERPGEGRASSHAGLTPEGGRARAVGGGPQTPVPFPERPTSCCALRPETLWPCLPAVGPGQTVSLSDPSFHHFTWKDLKVRRRCRPAWLRPEGSGSFQQSGKRANQPLTSFLPTS